MKKIVSVLLVISMLLSLAGVHVYAASADKTATFTLKASVSNASASGQAQDRKDYLNAAGKTVYKSTDGKAINVYPGQVVWVTLHLKTGSKYYAGDLQAYVYYSTNIFKSTDQSSGCYIWESEGKYSSVCSTTGSPFSKMVDSAIKGIYPSGWSESQKKAHGFYSIIMYPHTSMTTTVKSNIDEDLVTIPIYVRSDAKPGDKGTIYLPAETVQSSSNTGGNFILSNYVNGELSGKNVPYAKDYAIDVSKAKLNFAVVGKTSTKGDVNSDGRINASDALLVLQASTAYITLSDSQKKLADVASDGKINSSDALKILQYATGKITRF